MFNAHKPDPSELPSTGRLLRSTGIAAVIAAALLTTVVLPAEYGVDPTGVGALFGLTEMGRMTMQLAQEADAEAELPAAQASPQASPAAPPLASVRPADASAPAPADQGPTRSDTTTVTLAPDQGSEVKLIMEEGAIVTFEWFTDGPKVNYDTHGDGAGIDYHGYGKGTRVDRQNGKLTAAFTGGHGWFWRNRSGEPVTITLRTAGEYSEIKRYD